MTIRTPSVLPVRGPLNTADPKSDRAPGTLITARNVGHRWWGPRLGRKAVTWPSSASIRDCTPGVGLLDITTGAYIHGEISSFQQDVKSSYTLDIVLRPIAAFTGTNEIFQWRVGTAADLIVRTHTSGSLGRVQVFFAGVAGGAHLTSTTAMADATSDLTNVCHIRIVRDNTAAYLYMDGVLEDSATGLASSKLVWNSRTEDWYIGGALGTLEAQVYRVTLRKNVYNDSSAGYVDLQYPRGDDVSLAVAGAVGSSSNIVRDYSRWRSHGIATMPVSTGDWDKTPYINPVQGMASYRDRDGILQDIVMVGGNLVVRDQ